MIGVLLKLAWRNLWRHPRRTALTAAAVALGLALLLVFLGTGDGGHLQMIEAAVRMGSGHVVVQAPEYQRRRGVELALPAPTVGRVTAWVAGRPGPPPAVLARAFSSGLLASADGATGVSLAGIDPAAEGPVSRFPSRITAGRFLEAGDRAGAVVGRGVARLLKAEVGSRVVAMAQSAASSELRSALFEVVGVLGTGLDEIDESLVLVTLPALQAFLELGGAVHQVALVLDDQAGSGAWAAAAARAFPDLEVLTWAQANPQLEAFITLDDGGNYLFNGLFFVLIAFMVLNTLLMATLERRREFALLDALGLPASRRVAMVLLEAVLLAAVATAAGLALGLAGHTYFRVYGLPLAWFTSHSLEAGGVVIDPILYSVLSPARVVGSVTLIFVMTLLLALVAARHAARRVDPGLLKPR